MGSDKDWIISYDKYDPENEMHTEVICAIGNGYVVSRGAFAELNNIEDIHYPGTYMAGVYNRLISKVGERDVENEDLVNCPDWTQISFKIDDGPRFSLEDVEILSYNKEIDLRQALYRRSLRFKSNTGEIFKLISERFISMADRHLAALRYTILPESASPVLTIRSALEGRIKNDGIKRYRELSSKHLLPVAQKSENGCLSLNVKTSQSGIELLMYSVHSFHNCQVLESNPIIEPGLAAVETVVQTQKGEAVVVEKMTSMANSLQTKGDPAKIVMESALKFDFKTAFAQHKAKWADLWSHIDITLSKAPEITKILRLHNYHLLLTASPFNTELDTGIPARGWHGEAYRGHIFWDEMYILPFYLWNFPRVAESILQYRIHRLSSAIDYASAHNYKGAMYPWQSGSDGREETQVLHLNPNSGEWGPDYSSIQRHVSLAVFYNIWSYVKTVEDSSFLEESGAEVLLMIAGFWVSILQKDEKSGKYHTSGLMGPNEYHEMLPGADKNDGGLPDNAYTNVMISWALLKCLELKQMVSARILEKVLAKCGISKEEFEAWGDIRKNITINVEEGIIDQYRGFLKLKKIDFDTYRKKYGNIGRLDRILKAEGKSPDDFQLSKQADLLMIFYLLPYNEACTILGDLGVPFAKKDLEKNYDFYLSRTTHGSTLSLIVHAYLAALIGRSSDGVEWYLKSLKADFQDIQNGTTREGIHTGLMAGTIIIMLRAYAGLDLSGDILTLKPAVPKEWGELSFSVLFRDINYQIKISSETISILPSADSSEVVAVSIGDKITQLSLGIETTIKI